MSPSIPQDTKSPLEMPSHDQGSTMRVSHSSPQKPHVQRTHSVASLSQHGTGFQPGQQDDKNGSEPKNANTIINGMTNNINTNTTPNTTANTSTNSVSNPNLTTFGTSSNPTTTPSSAGGGKGVTGPSVINKQLLSKLNKSLKEKQKITSAREIQTKNPTLIQNVLSTSPSFTAISNIPGNTTPSFDNTNALGAAPLEDHSKSDTNDADLLSVTSSAQNQSKDAAVKSKAKKGKRIAKQNSTRTDFFAAKLASAVDDVSSSDSDETFVYETNAHEFGDETNDVPGTSTGTNVSPHVAAPKDHRATDPGGNAENINHAPSSIQIVNDNISVSGSLRNAPFDITSISPSGEHRKDDDKDLGAYVPSVVASRAESIHSLQSSKPILRSSFHATPPMTTNGRTHQPPGLAPQNDYQTFSDPYMDTHSRYSRQPMRKSSSHSILSDERKDHLLRGPHSPYGASKLNGISNPVAYGLSEHSHNSSRPYQEGLYVYGEEDASGDDVSSHGDITSICTDNNAQAPSISNGNKPGDNLPAGYKPKSNKPSTTSSKLRSTTSKLFDKKGAQPRRYSTIPDDIDIEDFDDELIYYDNNNIRFPYYNNQGSLNESSSLLNGHKLPHHRSLNLNFNGKRTASHPRNTRYVSLGYTPSGSYGTGNKKGDIFPFPYPDHQQSFYGFDEYDEDSQIQSETNSPKHPQGRHGLSPNNNHFLLPRKMSQDPVGNDKLRIIKNVIYTLIGIICILSVGFVSGFLLASTKDLTNVSIIDINHATVSQDELVFNVVVEALNPGWFTVSLVDLELDVFAKSGYLEEGYNEKLVETVLLGSVLNFESALRFEGSFFNRQAAQQTGEIKLVGPGKNFTGSRLTDLSLNGTSVQNSVDEPNDPKGSPDNSEKWTVISKHPFDLILRGVIKYNLPWTNTVKSVVVNKVGYIDPSSAL